MKPEAQAEALRESFLTLRQAIQRVIIGQQSVVDGLLTAILANGHVLIEGAPGLGKTLLVKALGQGIGLRVGRVQFTPDLMPSDILGTHTLQQTADGPALAFREGPVFCELLLADEINRANPRTQAALLEAMAEQQVTTGGETRRLGPPFFVLATENPIEMDGTYPLPEAQADRFLMKLDVPPPETDDLVAILDVDPRQALDALVPCLSREDLVAYQGHTASIPAADSVKRGLAELIRRSRPDRLPPRFRDAVQLGVSPRGAQALFAAARARAALAGRLHVTDEDVHAMAPAVLRHRILLSFAGRAEGLAADDVVAALLAGG